MAGGSINYNAGVKEQKFTSTSGQTKFTVTDFNINDYYVVFVDGALQSFGHTRTDQDIDFSVGQSDGSEILIIN